MLAFVRSNDDDPGLFVCTIEPGDASPLALRRVPCDDCRACARLDEQTIIAARWGGGLERMHLADAEDHVLWPREAWPDYVALRDGVLFVRTDDQRLWRHDLGSGGAPALLAEKVMTVEAVLPRGFLVRRLHRRGVSDWCLLGDRVGVPPRVVPPPSQERDPAPFASPLSSREVSPDGRYVAIPSGTGERAEVHVLDTQTARWHVARPTVAPTTTAEWREVHEHSAMHQPELAAIGYGFLTGHARLRWLDDHHLAWSVQRLEPAFVVDVERDETTVVPLATAPAWLHAALPDVDALQLDTRWRDRTTDPTGRYVPLRLNTRKLLVADLQRRTVRAICDDLQGVARWLDGP